MPKRRESLTPDITPLIDIIFLLLIFFLVTSVFKESELALELNLPELESKSSEIEQKEITIEVSENKVSLNGVVLTLKKFKESLKDIERDRVITLRVDKDVKYQRVIEVLEALQSQNLNNLALINQFNSSL